MVLDRSAEPAGGHTTEASVVAGEPQGGTYDSSGRMESRLSPTEVDALLDLLFPLRAKDLPSTYGLLGSGLTIVEHHDG